MFRGSNLHDRYSRGAIKRGNLVILLATGKDMFTLFTSLLWYKLVNLGHFPLGLISLLQAM